jgi:protein SCO1/2
MTKLAQNVSFLFLFCCSLTLFSSCHEEPVKALPILGNYDLNYSLKDGKQVIDTIYQTIPDFQFFNEDSIIVNKATFKNKVWITEFFFATCPSICPIMNTQLKNVEKALQRYSKDLQFLSFTIDPKHDTPSVLKAHKQKLGIQNKNWAFLSGNEAFTHQLGIEHFLIFAGREDEALGGYAHSGAFTLVDKKGQVRGVYEVVQPDLSVNKKEYQRLIKEAKQLFQDEYNYTKK